MRAIWTDLGAMDYLECCALQRQIAEGVAAGTIPDSLCFVEHPPVLTLGAGFHERNLILARDEYARRGIGIAPTDRGGDVTYHGPGQVVVYPIFDVSRHGRDLHRWLRDLEEAVIAALRGYGLAAERRAPHTGVWLPPMGEKPWRKIAAIGIKVKRWVSTHGIALNCANDLSPFEMIVPCGIEGAAVTSISQELARDVAPGEVRGGLVKAFAEVFQLEIEQESRSLLETSLV